MTVTIVIKNLTLIIPNNKKENQPKLVKSLQIFY